MTKFRLTCAVTVSAWTEVEAESLEAAIEEAQDRSVELDFNGAGVNALEAWLVDECDGSPTNIEGPQA